MRSQEEEAIEKAKSADRAAKYQLKSKLKKTPNYLELDEKEQKRRQEDELDRILDARFQEKKSGELSRRFITLQG